MAKTYVDNGAAITFMVIMIIIIIFLVLALTLPSGGCRRNDDFVSCRKNEKGTENKHFLAQHKAAVAQRMQGDGFLEASGLGQKFPKFESTQIDGTKLGFNRPLTLHQDAYGSDVPIIFNIPKSDFEIQKHGMKPSRNQIFVNRINMNPGDCGNGIPNDIYMAALFNEDDDSIVSGSSCGLNSGSVHGNGNESGKSLIHLVKDEKRAHELVHKSKDGVIVVASHGCGACKGLMKDLEDQASKDSSVRSRLLSGHVHFIDSGAFQKVKGHERFGQVTGIPTTFHLKDGKVHNKIVGKRPVHEILGLK